MQAKSNTVIKLLEIKPIPHGRSNSSFSKKLFRIQTEPERKKEVQDEDLENESRLSIEVDKLLD